MFYEIDNKYYVKAAGRYTEVRAKINEVGQVIFVPTKNILSIIDVGRDYTLVSSNKIRQAYLKDREDKSKSKKQNKTK